MLSITFFLSKLLDLDSLRRSKLPLMYIYATNFFRPGANGVSLHTTAVQWKAGNIELISLEKLDSHNEL